MDDQPLYQLENSGRPRVRLSDAVLQHLTDLILARALRPGDSLPSESELARSFDVSKPVVREALRQLAAMGVVEIRQGRPSCISPLSSKPLELYLRLAVRSQPTGLREALELRRALETHTVVLAAERRTDDDIQRLRDVIARMERYKDENDDWVAADLDFHRTLAEASGNSLMRLHIEALSGTIEDTIRALHTQRDVRDSKATLARHVAIVDAVARQNATEARLAMEVHFDAALPVALRILEEKHRQAWR